MIHFIFYEILSVLSAGIGCAIFVEMFPEKRWKSGFQIPVLLAAFGAVSMLQAEYERAFFISNTGLLICSILYAQVVYAFCRCKYEDALI